MKLSDLRPAPGASKKRKRVGRGDGSGHGKTSCRGKPLAVACSVGNRSSIAVSLLRRAGIDDVIHVVDGGVAELADEGIELVRTGS